MIQGILLILLLAVASFGNAAKVELNDKNFDKILKRGDTMLLWFYADYCGHCQKVKPAVKAAVDELAGIADIAYIRCDDNANREICSRYGIRGFPTFKIVHSKFEKKDVQSTARVFPTVEYQGNRETNSLVNFVMLHLKPSFEHYETPAQLIANASKVQNAENAIIIFSEKKNPTSLMYRLAKKFTADKYSKNTFFIITSTTEDSVGQYTNVLPGNLKSLVQDYRGFKLIVKKGDNYEAYNGKNSKDDINNWLANNLN